MKKIIVNADDFGINDEVTAEIERMINLGAITSTTVMANGSSLDEVRRFVSTHREISYGIHLCLSEFKSLTNNPILKETGIVNLNGDFIKMAIFKIKTFHNPEIQEAIKEELHAQIDVVSSLGFTISHADSHHHVHTIYPLRDIFAEVLHKRGIKRIRLGVDFHSLRDKAHLCKWRERIFLNKFYRKQFVTTDAFYNYSDFIRTSRSIAEDSVVELMCHPGHTGEDFQNEMRLVEEKQALKNAKLISYNELL